MRFIPAVGEFIAEADTKGEVPAKLHDVLRVPGAKETSPAQRGRVGHNLEAADGALQECGQAGKAGLAKLAGCGVLVVLYRLEPHAYIELVYAFGELKIVLIGEKISAI